MGRSSLRANVVRYVFLATSYAADRSVLFLAVFLPALAAVSAADIGRVELLVVAGTTGANIGPLGTANAVMHQRFSDGRRNFWFACITGVIFGSAIGGLLSFGIGPGYGLLGAVMGGSMSLAKVAKHRVRVVQSLGPLVLTSALLASGFLAVAGFAYFTGASLARAIPIALVIGSVIAVIPALQFVWSKLKPGIVLWREMLLFGLPMAASVVSTAVVTVSDRYMLNWIMDTEAVGNYGVIYRSVMLLAGVTSTAVMWWKVETLRRGSQWAFRRVWAYLRLSTVGAVAASVMLWWPFSAYLSRLLSLEFSTVSAMVAWLLLSIVGFVIASALLAPLVSIGNTRPVAFVWTFNAMVNVGLNLLLIAPYGMVGAAFATAGSQTAAAILAHRAFRRASVADS